MGKVTGLAHIGVIVKDLETSKKFYMDNLGFKLDDENDLGRVKLAFISNGTCLIELICYPEPKEISGAGVVDHICMEVEGIDEIVDELKARGINFEGPVGMSTQIRGGIKNVFFSGPDGERIEFFEYQR